MSTTIITQGQSVLIDPRVEYADSGWTISGKYATHGSCFPGTMEYVPDLLLVDGHQYNFTYFVDQYVTGGVRLDLGVSVGTLNSASGVFTETFTYNTGDVLKFYSDGGLRLRLLQIAEHFDEPIVNSQTFAFNEVRNKWVSDYSYVPELMLKFSDRFFSFKDGGVWEHDTNSLYNNFYGIQYPSQITFVVNVDYQKDKLFYNMRLDALGNWSAPSLVTVGSNQFPNGMYSQLKKGNFKLIDGKLWADLLGDINDPNFAMITDPSERRLKALFEGRKLQGGWLVVELQCNDITKSEISSVEVYYTDVMRGF